MRVCGHFPLHKNAVFGPLQATAHVVVRIFVEQFFRQISASSTARNDHDAVGHTETPTRTSIRGYGRPFEHSLRAPVESLVIPAPAYYWHYANYFISILLKFSGCLLNIAGKLEAVHQMLIAFFMITSHIYSFHYDIQTD